MSAGICRKFELDKFDCMDTDTGCGSGDACKEGICRLGYSCESKKSNFVDRHYLLMNCDGAKRTGVCLEGKKNNVK